jgi:hypothetical protein
MQRQIQQRRNIVDGKILCKRNEVIEHYDPNTN